MKAKLLTAPISSGMSTVTKMRVAFPNKCNMYFLMLHLCCYLQKLFGTEAFKFAIGVFTRADEQINAERPITGPLKTLLETSMKGHYMYINNRAGTQYQMERQRELLIEPIDLVVYENQEEKFTHQMFMDANAQMGESKKKIVNRLIKEYNKEVGEKIINVVENHAKSMFKLPSAMYDTSDFAPKPPMEKLTEEQFVEIKLNVIEEIQRKERYGTGLLKRFPCVTEQKVREENIESLVDCHLKDMKYDWQLDHMSDGKTFHGKSKDQVLFQKGETAKLFKKIDDMNTRSIGKWTNALLDELEKEAKLFLENKGYAVLQDMTKSTSEPTKTLAKKVRKKCSKEKFVEYFNEEEARHIIAEYAIATRNSMGVLKCFPHDAVIKTENRGVVQMDNVRVGDRIATKNSNDHVMFEDVFMLGMTLQGPKMEIPNYLPIHRP